MTKKFAVCFSGYPRFVRKQFDSIKKNILDASLGVFEPKRSNLGANR